MKGTGKIGVQFNDRVLAAEVRSLSLEKIKKVLLNEKHKLFAPVLISMSRSVLPRLNEISGEDGKPVIIQISGVGAKKYGLDPSAK